MRYNRISAKERVPCVADGPDGPRWVAKNGATFGLAGGVGASGTKYVPGKQLRVDVMAATIRRARTSTRVRHASPG